MTKFYIGPRKAIELLTDVAQSIKEQEKPGVSGGHAYLKITSNGITEKLEATKGSGKEVSFKMVTEMFKQVMEQKDLTIAQKHEAIRAYETISEKFQAKEVGFFAKHLFGAEQKRQMHMDQAGQLIESYKREILDKHSDVMGDLQVILTKSSARDSLESKNLNAHITTLIASLSNYFMLSEEGELTSEQRISYQKALKEAEILVKKHSSPI